MLTPDYGALLETIRRSHVLVREGNDWVAYRPGRYSRWGQWRAIRMLGGLESDRVTTVPTVRGVHHLPHPDTIGCPDTPPGHWQLTPTPTLPDWARPVIPDRDAPDEETT